MWGVNDIIMMVTIATFHFLKTNATATCKSAMLRTVGAVLFSLSRTTCLVCTASCPLTFTVELILSGSTRPRRWWTFASLYAGWWRYLVLQTIAWVGNEIHH